MEELIEAELVDLRKNCESQVSDSKLVTCVRSSVRVELTKSQSKKLCVCLTFPVNYPSHNLLVELKSRTLSLGLLDGLVKVTEDEAKKSFAGRPHCLHVIKFVRRFLEENPLCCCWEDLAKCKEMLQSDTGDAIRLSQKTSSVTLNVTKNKYYFKAKVVVPNDYPLKQVSFDQVDSNFPRIFRVWLLEQAREIARRCVQPPLKKTPKMATFEPKSSLGPAVAFLIENVKRYPVELCQGCGKCCFPEDPAEAVHNENAAAHVERVYCSHCYHHDCLILYMKTPPFQNGKKCQGCGQRIYHEKWKVTPELAEARWAHEQAKSRELGEVVEFFGDLATTS